MPAIMTTPTMKSKRLVRSLVPVWSTEEAMAKMKLKKNKTATAIPPNTAMIFTSTCVIEAYNLTLRLVELMGLNHDFQFENITVMY